VVTACRAADVDCADPVASYVDTVGAGEVSIFVPWEFAGFLEFRSDTTLTSLYYVVQPVVMPRVAQTVLLITPDVTASSPSSNDAPIDLPRTGLVAAQLRDCAGAAVAGVRFEIARSNTTSFFIVDGRPSAEPAVTVFDPATSMAVGGFFNVEPGATELTARLGLTGPVLARVRFNVRANSVAQLEIFP
jgi:hypothetical protein